jgi:hypothetical protein
MTAQKRVLLNRAVFAQRPFDSGALTVLTTLLHRFAEPGDYDITVRSPGKRDRSLRVQVTTSSAPDQINIDLAALDRPAGEPGCCPGESDYTLQTNGVMGFYASQGVDAYSLVIKRRDLREKKVFLDSASQIPAGDLFAVTLVRPGAYKVTDVLSGKFETLIQVGMPPIARPEQGPKPGQKGRQPKTPPGDAGRYRPDQPTLVTFDKNGFSSKEIRLFAGQSAVFHCQVPARLRVEAAQKDEAAGQPKPKKLSVKRVMKR